MVDYQTLARERPVLFLSISFLLWKTVVLLCVLAAPGIGYDTCTTHLESSAVIFDDWRNVSNLFEHNSFKVIRWDAIYFTHMAAYGHVFEQEWAFGVGISTIIATLSKVLPTWDTTLVIAGLISSHITHYLSVIVTWQLARVLASDSERNKTFLPFLPALLHIISPAGVFLTAPYTESPFSFLNMTGFLLYSLAAREWTKDDTIRASALTVCAGVSFGIATVVRSNGLLSGIPFAIDACVIVITIFRRGLTGKRFLKLSSLVLGGMLIAVGTILPQLYAYREYCILEDPMNRRSWCKNTIPSIFTWVQVHYWNVGFLHYWTFPNNVPLFAMASPAIFVLVRSGLAALREYGFLSGTQHESPVGFKQEMLVRYAIPQLILATLAVTNYHVQIITRLSSGYPQWYFWLAQLLYSDTKVCSRINLGRVVVSWMVIYALVQASLFGSFLPPA